MSRKTTPDILDALMGSKKKIQSNNQNPFKKALKTEIKPFFENLGKHEGMKEKATFNLSKSILNDLEDCWMEIRKLRQDKKISKTDIVEQALEDAIKDFKKAKSHSQFYKKLESGKAIKQ